MASTEILGKKIPVPDGIWTHDPPRDLTGSFNWGLIWLGWIQGFVSFFQRSPRKQIIS